MPDQDLAINRMDMAPKSKLAPILGNSIQTTLMPSTRAAKRNWRRRTVRINRNNAVLGALDKASVKEAFLILRAKDTQKIQKPYERGALATNGSPALLTKLWSWRNVRSTEPPSRH